MHSVIKRIICKLSELDKNRITNDENDINMRGLCYPIDFVLVSLQNVYEHFSLSLNLWYM